MWEKFATKIRAFGAGVKALYKDLKQINEYRVKYGGHLEISKTAPELTESGKVNLLYPRKELQFVYRVNFYSSSPPLF